MRINLMSIKRKICLILALILMLLCACSSTQETKTQDETTMEEAQNEEQKDEQDARAVTSADATNMRLEKIVGSVVVKNEQGEEITSSEGMRLNSGYEIITSELSFAYISLDDDKALKLDENSDAKIENDSKNLLITLIDGYLYYNVTKPLEDDEIMNITTSNMITGIRGTQGYVGTYIENELQQSVSALVSGMVTINAIEEDGELLLTSLIKEYEIAYYDYDEQENHLRVDVLVENDIPEFVKAEIYDDYVAPSEGAYSTNQNNATAGNSSPAYVAPTPTPAPAPAATAPAYTDDDDDDYDDVDDGGDDDDDD